LVINVQPIHDARSEKHLVIIRQSLSQVMTGYAIATAPLHLQNIFDGFNKVVIFTSGVSFFVTLRRMPDNRFMSVIIDYLL